MTTEPNQIKPRYNIISQASAVRFLLKSQVLCTASFSLLLKNTWRILCSLRSRVKKEKKQDSVEGSSEGKV